MVDDDACWSVEVVVESIEPAAAASSVRLMFRKRKKYKFAQAVVCVNPILKGATAQVPAWLKVLVVIRLLLVLAFCFPHTACKHKASSAKGRCYLVLREKHAKMN